MRRQDDAARVAGPMGRVQPRVIFRQERVARVAEDRFDEIQVADQIARREEADLHGLLLDESRHRGADHGPHEQGNKTFRLLLLRGGERQRSNDAGGCNASASNRPKTMLGTAFLSSGIGRPPSAT
jgi:hypothetical protein